MDSSNGVLDSSWLQFLENSALREAVLSRDAVVVYADGLTRVEWANVSGAALFGGTNVSEFLTAEFDKKHPFLRQLAAAVQQLGKEKIYRGFRVVEEGHSRLLQCEISYCEALNNNCTGERDIIVSCQNSKFGTMREDAFSQLVLDSFAPLGAARAICDKFGLVISASDAFVEAGIFPDAIEEACVQLVENAQHEFSLESDGQENIDVKIYGLNARNDRYLVVINDDAQGSEAIVVPRESNDQSELDDPHQNERVLEVAQRDDEVEGDGEKVARFEPEPEPEGTDSSGETLGIVSGVVAGFAATSAMLFGPKRPDENAQESEEGTKDERVSQLQDKTQRAEEIDVVKDDDDHLSGDEVTELEDTETVLSDEKDDLMRSVQGEAVDATADDLTADDVTIDDTNGHDGHENDLEAKASAEEVARAQSLITSAADDAQTGNSSEEFIYNGESDPVRFRWVTDTEQVVTFVSPELAEAVGPNAADLEGRKWSDIARVFGFDTNGEIQRLLEARDTWSGKSVLWPIQGTDLHVPIDLAALPSFSSGRNFDGFRGFGIVRMLDAIVDPDETGLALVDGPIAQRDVSEAESLEHQSELDLDDDGIAVADFAEEPVSSDEEENKGMSGSDERHELDEREQAAPDNIVPLNVRRNSEIREKISSETSQARLTNGENKAFQEIGEKLRETSRFGISHLHHRESKMLDVSDGHDVSQSIKLSPEIELEASGVDTTLLQKLPIPVVVYRDNHILFANNDFLNLLGFSDLSELNERGGLEGLFDGAKHNEEEQDENNDQANLVLRDKNDKPLSVKGLLQTVPWDGERAYLLSFRQPRIDDLPENEKIVLDMMRVSELQNILDTATDGIIVLDNEGIIQSVNQSAEALFDRAEKNLRALPLTQLFASESHDNINKYVNEVAESGSKSVFKQGCDVVGVEEKGGLIPLYITIGKIGSSDKLCAILRDMTSWKKTQQELERAKKQAETVSDQKTEFLARVSHEIRTPLNAIIGFSDVMIDERFGPVENERYREYLRDINRSGVHVLDLINDLLDISKIEAGKMDLVFEAVDLNQLVGETVALLQPQANGNRVLIRTSLSRAVPNVVADARSVRQIVLNLVSNAIKFTEANGQVIVSTVYEGNGEVALRVRDTGQGMSEEEVEIALKPFRQINTISETHGQGTGLGLPLTKALVEANKAFLDIESEPDEGTIVHIQFPSQRVLAD